MICLDNQTEHRGERGGHRAGFTCRPDVDEDDGVLKAGRQIMCDRYCDGGLTNPPRTHNGAEALFNKLLRYLENVVRASDHFNWGPGQTGLRQVGIEVPVSGWDNA